MNGAPNSSSFVERAEEVDDVVHALVELRPVAGAAVVGRRAGGLEAREQLEQVGDRPASAARRGTGRRGSCRAPAIRPGSASTMNESRDDVAGDGARGALEPPGDGPRRARGDAAGARGRHAPGKRPPARVAEILGRRVARVQRLADLRLQPGLLVQPDLEVREHESCARAVASSRDARAARSA